MQHRTITHRPWQGAPQAVQPVPRARAPCVRVRFGGKDGGAPSSSGAPENNHHYSSSNGTGASSNGASTSNRTSSSSSSQTGIDNMTAILQETQRHLLELNSKRIKVTEELAVANERIKQLEQQVEQLQAEARQHSPEAARQLAGAQHKGANSSTSHSPGASASTSSGSLPAPAAAPPATISITYHSGWADVYIHCNADGKGWTTAPGIKMDRVGGDQPQAHVKVIEGSQLEFVLNDGRDSWEKPSLLYGETSNYLVGGPGTYVVTKGKLEKLQ